MGRTGRWEMEGRSGWRIYRGGHGHAFQRERERLRSASVTYTCARFGPGNSKDASSHTQSRPVGQSLALARDSCCHASRRRVERTGRRRLAQSSHRVHSSSSRRSTPPSTISPLSPWPRPSLYPACACSPYPNGHAATYGILASVNLPPA
ncbi:hypothetical protein PYCCODRAFT_919404 [Trametes coccinea BRFM310]|uniref:Uncharacterized protein n=1 Tax=Trametes coccinea (strain BRFM310) TaxID=1353009 RepID=A0A1Y2IYS2_TRAC3|nr:hypothetical protein PYCCODRAFT_919404 [Trametes coccinea BRFM310]